MQILNIIRWKNLLIIGLTQYLIKYAYLEPFGVIGSLNGLGMTLLILATLCIAAAGNIINDIYDIKADRINKPNRVIVGQFISEKRAYNLFFGLNIVGLVIGFYLSHAINKPPFFSLFVFASIVLYVYATSLKKIALIGNIMISILVALSIIIVGVFDIMPLLQPHNQKIMMVYFKTISIYALFAFSINVLREIVKDLEDIEGDLHVEANTLPIKIGKTYTTYFIAALNVIVISLVIYYITSTLQNQKIAIIYFLLCIVAPLCYTTYKLYNASTKSIYTHIGNVYKWIMVFGILSLLLYKYVILYR